MRNLRDELTAYWLEAQAELPAAWRSALGGAEPNFSAVPADATLDPAARIVPLRGETTGPFCALEGIDPEDVAVVIIDNDPYPDPGRATGRSFEQGDLGDWVEALGSCRVTPSLLSLACAAAALLPTASESGLDGTRDRGKKLLRALQCGVATLPSPQSMFENLTGQGVLWVNCTPTISAQESGQCWKPIKPHRKWHRALWCPITDAILTTLVREARTRPVVFALFGAEAGKLPKRIERLVQAPNLRLVKAGHPSMPHLFLRCGNPLRRVNAELISQGRDPIDWCDPAAITPTAGAGRARSRAGSGGRAASVRAVADQSAGASARSIAIMDRTVGKYGQTLRRLAER